MTTMDQLDNRPDDKPAGSPTPNVYTTRNSATGYALAAVFAFMGLFLMSGISARHPPPSVSPFQILLGLVTIAVGLYWAYYTAVSRLTVSKDGVEYYNGMRKITASWDEAVEIRPTSTVRGGSHTVLVLTGILFTYSRTPWGPWSEPQVIFNDVRDGGLGKFIHDPAVQPDDGLEGPVNVAGQANPAAVKGNVYGPYVVERWTKVQGSELDLFYLMSTWNPYVVVLMKSRLTIG